MDTLRMCLGGLLLPTGLVLMSNDNFDFWIINLIGVALLAAGGAIIGGFSDGQ